MILEWSTLYKAFPNCFSKLQWNIISKRSEIRVFSREVHFTKKRSYMSRASQAADVQLGPSQKSKMESFATNLMALSFYHKALNPNYLIGSWVRLACKYANHYLWTMNHSFRAGNFRLNFLLIKLLRKTSFRSDISNLLCLKNASQRRDWN